MAAAPDAAASALSFVESVSSASAALSSAGVDTPQVAATGIAGALKAVLSKAKGIVSNRAALELQLAKVRVLSRSFFNPLEFSKPPDRAQCLHRIQVNAAHYKAIYGLVVITCLVYTILSSPLLLLGLALMLAAWLYAFVLNPADATITVCGQELRRREKFVLLIPFSLLVVLVTGLINSLFSVLMFSALIAVPHASFHECGELDALDALELQGLQEDPIDV